MKLGTKVALSISDPGNPDRYVQLRGTVTRVRQDEVAAAHIDQLAYKYMGLDKNPLCQSCRRTGDVRNLRVFCTGHELIGWHPTLVSGLSQTPQPTFVDFDLTGRTDKFKPRRCAEQRCRNIIRLLVAVGSVTKEMTR